MKLRTTPELYYACIILLECKLPCNPPIYSVLYFFIVFYKANILSNYLLCIIPDRAFTTQVPFLYKKSLKIQRRVNPLETTTPIRVTLKIKDQESTKPSLIEKRAREATQPLYVQQPKQC